MMQHGQRPNELVVKKLSMLGCVALVLAHSVKDMQDKLRGYHAGRAPSSHLPFSCLYLLHKALLAPEQARLKQGRLFLNASGCSR